MEENPYLHPVEFADGGYRVRFSDHDLLPITGHDGPAVLLPGWKPKFVYSGLAPVHIWELVHDDGSESTWFLDQNMAHIGTDDMAGLPHPHVAIARQQSLRLLMQLWNEMLCSIYPTPSLETLAFFSPETGAQNAYLRIMRRRSEHPDKPIEPSVTW